MKNLFLIIYFLLLTLTCEPLSAAKIGLLVTATGKYISFVNPLIKSAEKNFCKKHKVTYFVFTDSKLPSTNKIKFIYQPRLGWPFDSMMRFQAYAKQEELLKSQDYLFAIDADMSFVGKVGSEILGDLVATTHPLVSLIEKKDYSYERNPKSRACVREHEGVSYYAGGFYGGKYAPFMSMVKTLSHRIDADQKDGITAVWHDESHLNRYFIDIKPSLVLSTSYCYPEGTKLPFKPKILALLKNHQEMRN